MLVTSPMCVVTPPIMGWYALCHGRREVWRPPNTRINLSVSAVRRPPDTGREPERRGLGRRSVTVTVWVSQGSGQWPAVGEGRGVVAKSSAAAGGTVRTRWETTERTGLGT